MKTEDKTQVMDSDTLSLYGVMKDGYRFEFVDGDNKIECWGSGKSGNEAIYLNGEEVSALRNLFSRKSLHKFSSDTVGYEVEFNMVSLTRGELHCILIKDGVHFQTKKVQLTSFSKNKPLTMKQAFFEGFVFGFFLILGGFAGYYLTKLFLEKADSVEQVSVLTSLIAKFWA